MHRWCCHRKEQKYATLEWEQQQHNTSRIRHKARPLTLEQELEPPCPEANKAVPNAEHVRQRELLGEQQRDPAESIELRVQLRGGVRVR